MISNVHKTGNGKQQHFIVHNHEVLMKRTGDELRLCTQLPPQYSDRVIYQRSIGLLPEQDFVVFEIADTQPKNGLEFVDLRDLLGLVPEQEWLDAGRAVQIVRWHRDHQYCSRCGRQVNEGEREFAKTCSSCNMILYPRLSPAVIMSVTDGERILLGRAHRYPRGMYTNFAGYVEPGETMEQAVLRELMEEVGIIVDDITYVGSQPWPFPHSMMAAFTTCFVKGEIRLNREELEDARWFSRDAMPERLPIAGSISRRLIDNYLHQTPK